MIHGLKTHQEPFEATANGSKTFEYRKNDRSFRLGDTLHLREYVPVGAAYTGRGLFARVDYILHGPEFGIPEGYCIMSIALTGGYT